MRTRASTLLSVVTVGVVTTIGALIPGLGPDAQAAFPGGNGRIAFHYGLNGGPIYTVRPDGKGRKRLTLPAVSLPTATSWKATGKRILIEDFRGIAIADADGSNVGRAPLPDFPAPPGDDESNPNKPWYSPAWAPDSSRFAVQYNSDDGPNQQIYVISFRGKKPKRVAFGIAPVWDPKDRFIAYLGDTGRCEGIRGVKPNGTGDKALFAPTKRIINRSSQCLYSPFNFDISPDGNRLAFVGLTSAKPSGSSKHDVYVVNIGGKAPRRLTTNGNARDVAWSPNGRLIAWTDDVGAVGARRALWTVGVAGGKSRRIVSGLVANPSWQPLP